MDSALSSDYNTDLVCYGELDLIPVTAHQQQYLGVNSTRTEYGLDKEGNGFYVKSDSIKSGAEVRSTVAVDILSDQLNGLSLPEISYDSSAGKLILQDFGGEHLPDVSCFPAKQSFVNSVACRAVAGSTDYQRNFKVADRDYKQFDFEQINGLEDSVNSAYFYLKYGQTPFDLSYQDFLDAVNRTIEKVDVTRLTKEIKNSPTIVDENVDQLLENVDLGL